MLFPWYTKYPYQNDEVLNLDWVLKTIENLVKEVSDFVSLNTIKYADPIQWNITTQYEKNTLVIDPISGTAYLSTKPVPAGVGLNNTDYWTVVFTLDVLSANKNITLRDDANNMLATFESAVGDWVLWQGTLYVVTRAIEIGQAYVEDYNIERATVEYFLKLYIDNLRIYMETYVGALTDLNTSDKTSIVNAINEVLGALGTVASNVGALTDLNTSDKTSIVNAINEVLGALGGLSSVVGALTDLNTSDKTSIVNAINEVNTNRINGDSAMSKRVKKFEDRRVILIGDSYLYGMYVDTNPYSRITSFGTYLKTYLNIADADFFMVDIDGGGFVTNGAAERQWLPQLQARASSITNHDTISDIYVVGGQNDVSKTGVAAAIASFATYCKSEYPNARLHIGFCGVDYINRDSQEAHIAAIKTYIEAGLENGMNYIQGIEYVLRNTTLLQSDHCHPEEAGQKALARFLVNYVNKNMNDGGLVTYGMEKPAFTAATGVSGTFSVNVMKAGTNTDVWFFFAQGFSLTSSGSVNWDGTHEIELGELSDSALWGFGYTGADSENYSNMEAPASFVIGGTVYGGHLNLHVRAKHVFCSPMIFTNSGNYMSGSITVIVPPQTVHTSVNSLLI